MSSLRFRFTYKVTHPSAPEPTQKEWKAKTGRVCYGHPEAWVGDDGWLDVSFGADDHGSAHISELEPLDTPSNVWMVAQHFNVNPFREEQRA